MTEAEKIICRLYLEDLDKNHTCNEYRLLMELLNKEPCEDAISRQVAIDALSTPHGILYPIRTIEQLQSAQPEKRTDKHTETHACVLIDRQAAIDALSEAGLINYAATGDGNGMIQAINVIKGLPPAQPERKKGEWIDYSEDGFVECPFCHSATNCDGNRDELHYCFSCGAELR